MGPKPPTEHPNGSASRWAIALPASVAVHLLLGIALLRGGLDPSHLAEAASQVRPIEIPLHLGIERSEADTPNWLGFETPTPHEASPSSVEQSQLTRALGEARDNLARALASQVQNATSQTIAQARQVLETLLAEIAQAQGQAQEPQPQPQPAQPQPAVEPQPVAEPAPKAEPTPEPSSEDGSPGLVDDRAADASSLPSEIRRAELGRVVAGEGLRIQTTRIVLTDLQRFLGRAPSPLVEISFARDGTVAKAAIARGQGTGRNDLDQALINAIYRWTASGARLDALDEDDPPLLIRLRILF